MLIAVSSSLFAYLDIALLPILGGAIASICVLIDGLKHPGMLYNVHLRAFHDLRNLQRYIKAQWKIGIRRKVDRDELVADIITYAEEERKKIGEYLREAETTFGKPKD